MEDLSQLADILNEKMGLSPYESRAYLSLMIHGPMSPTGIAQKADIPRPRVYDVVQNLAEKGLLVEQTGKPSIYAVIEPRQGLRNLLAEMEIETSKQLEEKRRTVKALIESLSQIYDRSRQLKLEKSRVWLSRRDSAFLAVYSEAIRNCQKEVLVASTSPRPPEKEASEAVEHAVKTGKSVRVLRHVTKKWSLEDLEAYQKYIEAGTRVKFLDAAEIPLRFMVFDERDVILVFPTQTALADVESLWLRIPPLAKILAFTFEELWKKGRPMLPILKDLIAEKTKTKSKEA